MKDLDGFINRISNVVAEMIPSLLEVRKIWFEHNHRACVLGVPL